MERTLRMNAHEAWTDCPYYEQLAYLGDNADGGSLPTCFAGTAVLGSPRHRAVRLVRATTTTSSPSATRAVTGRNPAPTRCSIRCCWTSLLPCAGVPTMPSRPSVCPGLRGLVEQNPKPGGGPTGNLGPVPVAPFRGLVPALGLRARPGLREGDASC